MRDCTHVATAGPEVSGDARRVTVERNHHVAERDEVDRWLRPRTDVVTARPGRRGEDGVTAFDLEAGPMHEWERTVRVDGGEGAGTVEVVEEVRYRLAVPIWGALFRFALKRHLRRPPRGEGSSPWWAPPVVVDARAATVLSLLCVMGAVAGYLGTLITQTLTYAADQFDAGTEAQGTLLASVRIGVLISLVVVSFADRRGRRTVLIAAAVGACAFTALGALTPGMVALGATQTLARSMSTVVALLVAIMAVEEMPAGARAFSVSVLTMTAGLGAGMCVVNLVYLDVAPWAWRIAFLLPLLAIYPCIRLGRHLPETRRFAARKLLLSPEGVVGDVADVRDATFEPLDPAEPVRTLDAASPSEARTGAPAARRGRFEGFEWGRFALLAASGFLWSLFLAPAAQFLNEFLRTERGFSGALIAVFVLATNTPAGIGIIVGGKLADRRGRRLIGAIGILGGVGFTVVSYLTWGVPLWAASVVASVIGGMAVPALAVYGPELFPTGQRGTANGGLQVVSVAGSSVGLLLAGWMADQIGGLGPAMAVLAIGPAILVVLVLALYPETAGRELEDLNPEDRLPGATDPATGGTTLS